MRLIKTIILSLTAFAAGTSATRADELSELVAAVAASSDIDRLVNDITSATFDSKPRYKATAKETVIDYEMLDGIFRSMKRQSLQNMRRDMYGEYISGIEDHTYIPPTLGKEFYRPVPGIITSRFGWRPQFQRIHHGIDLRLQIGDTVRAAVSGTVKHISYDPDGYGHYVVMTHSDGMETVYGHLQHALVAQGQFVSAGQPVALGGNTGNSTGPHLHFETRMGGVAVDPLILFDFYGNAGFFQEEPEIIKSHVPVYSHQSKSLKGKSTYIVRVGDTPQSIARQAGISVMRLCQLNMIQENAALEIGRMLIINN
ncbi:MAG: peptidoglycan DD-metalloendopeptidase family protein [Muribaculaceae bacterium]|nr:peptidoglycan DD-metalloendopeptidase family protein [Muribaculaceae bacterium]